MGPATHIVYMGMGEPLANVPATLESLRSLTEDAGISARRITVSTSGVVPGIEQLAASGMPVTLAVSLHAATDELRNRLVPSTERIRSERCSTPRAATPSRVGAGSASSGA